MSSTVSGSPEEWLDQAAIRVLFDEALMGIVVVDEEGKVETANPEFTRLFGWEMAELRGRVLDDLIAPPELREEARGLTRSLGNGSTLHSDVLRRTRAGKHAIYLDITDRVRAEERLARSEERLRTIFEAEPECVKLISTSGELLDINPVGLRLLEAEAKSDLDGRSLLSLVAEPFRTAFAGLMTSALQGRSGRLEFQMVGLRGTPRWMESHVVPLRENGGDEITGVLAITRETTERKEAELKLRRLADELEVRVAERTAELGRANRELERASRLKDEFLASMSHELRTPLSSVLGLAQALEEGIYGGLNPDQREALDGLQESARHLLDLITDILDLTKIEAGQLELAPQWFDLAQMGQACLGLIRPLAERKAIRVGFSCEVPPQAGVRADPRRVKQALVNLLGNAVKFTPQGGEIGLLIAVDQTAGEVRFTVWDSGIGISEDQRSRLFVPFTQLDGRLARAHGGTGLGLSLVDRIVRLHGGSVTVESEPQRGSRFTVRLPWRPETGPVRSAAPAIPPPAQTAGAIRVMVVDDNKVTVAILEDYLRAQGLVVETCTSGEDALTRLAISSRPDVILTDVQMPGMDGLRLIREIRNNPRPQVRGTPIIAVTALALPGDRERCLKAGADDYLAKPVDLARLRDHITRLAGRNAQALAP
jgi:PAS domain S-box-containing protein